VHSFARAAFRVAPSVPEQWVRIQKVKQKKALTQQLRFGTCIQALKVLLGRHGMLGISSVPNLKLAISHFLLQVSATTTDVQEITTHTERATQVILEASRAKP
jgi:hypothetical protein